MEKAGGKAGPPATKAVLGKKAKATRNKAGVAGQSGGRRCKTCAHSEREAIDRALINGDQTVNALAATYGLARTSLNRHRNRHLPIAEAAAEYEEHEDARGIDLLAGADELRREALAVLHGAKADGDRDVVLRAIREASRLLELMGRFRGEITDQTTVNVLISPIFVQLQTRILTALLPYPDARRACAAAMGEALTLEHQPTLALPAP